MSSLRRLWNVVRRSRLDHELRQEMDTHLALIEDDERSQGSSGDEARRHARSRFGNPLSYRERALDAVIATWIETAGKEIAFAARRLLRTPAFTLAAVATLGLAIGANVAIFAVVEGIVLKPLPYPDSDRLIELDHGAERLNMPSGIGMTRGLYYHYSERARTLKSVALYQTEDITLTGNGEPERILVAGATPSIALVLGVAPALGRWFTEQEGRPGAAPVVLLSHRLWMRRYGGDPGIIGRPVMLGGIQTEVVGITPPSFGFPDPRVDAWSALQVARTMGFGLWSYQGVARLRDGATVADARAELNGLIHSVAQAFPGDLYAAFAAAVA